MAYRNIQNSFWTDSKIEDDFTPEDKYFYLYLLTNPKTNLAGCYEISIKQMALDLGYDKSVVGTLLQRFEDAHGVIRYDAQTKEILILNWYKYNWIGSPQVRKAIENDISKIKNADFRTYLIKALNGEDANTDNLSSGSGNKKNSERHDSDSHILNSESDEEEIKKSTKDKNEIVAEGGVSDMVSIPSEYPIDRVSIPYGDGRARGFVSVSVSDNVYVSDNDTGNNINNNKNNIDDENIYTRDAPADTGEDDAPEIKPEKKQKVKDKQVFDMTVKVLKYLNAKIKTSYTATPQTVFNIRCRLEEGRTYDDFVTVIDKKAFQWNGTRFAAQLTPKVLFGEKHFDEYLNQPYGSGKQKKGGFKARDRDYDKFNEDLIKKSLTI